MKLLAFVLLPCGSFKIDISTQITFVKVIVLKISGQTIALQLEFNVKSTYTIRLLEGYKTTFIIRTEIQAESFDDL